MSSRVIKHGSADGVRGFTVLELIVTLAVSGFVLAIAHGVVVTITDGADRVGTAAITNNRKFNGTTLLRELLGRVEVKRERMFDGDSTSVRFGSWCRMPQGWLEPCRVSVSFRSNSGGVGLVVDRQPGAPILLHQQGESVAFRYLANPSHGGSWTASWGPSITAPLVIGVIVDADTLILRIGDRG